MVYNTKRRHKRNPDKGFIIDDTREIDVVKSLWQIYFDIVDIVIRCIDPELYLVKDILPQKDVNCVSLCQS